ncbi:hypothetical protein Q5W_07960 [Hydrogenophaga sp. PBC]|nr:hypothetical protein Q5W_07960 [Hydrogenophaga sp. PBC]
MHRAGLPKWLPGEAAKNDGLLRRQLGKCKCVLYGILEVGQLGVVGGPHGRQDDFIDERVLLIGQALQLVVMLDQHLFYSREVPSDAPLLPSRSE